MIYDTNLNFHRVVSENLTIFQNENPQLSDFLQTMPYHDWVENQKNEVHDWKEQSLSVSGSHHMSF